MQCTSDYVAGDSATAYVVAVAVVAVAKTVAVVFTLAVIVACISN